MSGLRASPETRRTMTAAERAETRALDDDLSVYLIPSPYWTSAGDRLWTCRIARGQVTLAEAGNYDNHMTAFRQARGKLERAAV